MIKKKIPYEEDIDVYNYLKKKKLQEAKKGRDFSMNQWRRDATRSKMEKEVIAKPIPKYLKNLLVVAVNSNNEPTMYCDPKATKVTVLENGAIIMPPPIV